MHDKKTARKQFRMGEMLAAEIGALATLEERTIDQQIRQLLRAGLDHIKLCRHNGNGGAFCQAASATEKQPLPAADVSQRPPLSARKGR